ncbi:hypothetical protein MRX96_028417 [Rhipicephalus microplus]
MADNIPSSEVLAVPAELYAAASPFPPADASNAQFCSGGGWAAALWSLSVTTTLLLMASVLVTAFVTATLFISSGGAFSSMPQQPTITAKDAPPPSYHGTPPKMPTVPRASFPDVFYDAPSQRRRNRACSSTACVEYARRLLRQINTSRDPCDDFYAYVCDDWVRARPLPLGSERLSVDTALVDGYAELLASGLRDNATSRFPPLRFLIDNCLRPQPNLFHALRAMFMDAARLRPWMAQSSARRRPSSVEVSRKLGVAYRELGVDALFRPFVVKEVSSNDTRRFVGLGEPSTVLLRGPSAESTSWCA